MKRDPFKGGRDEDLGEFNFSTTKYYYNFKLILDTEIRFFERNLHFM